MKHATPLALILVLVLLWQFDRRQQYNAGKAEAGLVYVRARVDTLTQRVVERDVIYKRDTVRLWREVERWDSLRVTDTVTVNDTVYVRRSAADTAIGMCLVTVRSCESRVSARDALIDTLRLNIKAEAARRPSFIETWGWRLGAAVAGYYIGKSK